MWVHLKPHEPHLQLLSQNLVVMSLETGPHIVSPHWSETLHNHLFQFSKFSSLDMAQRLRGALKQNLRWQCTGRLGATLYSRKEGFLREGQRESCSHHVTPAFIFPYPTDRRPFRSPPAYRCLLSALKTSKSAKTTQEM